MKRLFKMKLRDKKSVSKRIRSAFEELRDISCAYHVAMCPNAIGAWPGEPGPRPDGDADLQLLECMKSFVNLAIQGHVAIKTDKHPLDNIPDGPEHDGVDGPYCGNFERPKEWPKKNENAG